MPDDAKPTPQEQLRSLVEEVINQDDFTDDHVQRVHDHARAAAEHIRAELDWLKTAHVHNTAHVYRQKLIRTPVGTDKDGNPLFVENLVDDPKSTHRCHDCGRMLINDAGTEPLLICPKLHGRRPPSMKPTKANGAVECGQPGM